MALTIVVAQTLYTEPRGRMTLGSIAFDNHYPGDVNGYAVTAAQFGFKTQLYGIFFQVPGLNATYNLASGKVQCWVGVPAHTHDLLLKNAAVADGATTRVNAGANLLGANTGGNLTVAGGGANGGIVANTVSNPMVEVAHTINLAAYSGVFIAFGE
jgi:hypothetical protein